MRFLDELRWRLEIGDPTFMGWFTVAAYAVGAILAARAWRVSTNWIWLAVALAMAGLCLNKQLDLHSLVTDLGRVMSSHQGWYEHRREFQKWFILGGIGGCAGFGGWFIWRYHEFLQRHRLLAVGVLLLATYILLRAISFHHLDTFLALDLGGLKLGWVLELGGIFLVIAAAVRESAESG
jgi:hypothetical protein